MSNGTRGNVEYNNQNWCKRCGVVPASFWLHSPNSYSYNMVLILTISGPPRISEGTLSVEGNHTHSPDGTLPLMLYWFQAVPDTCPSDFITNSDVTHLMESSRSGEKTRVWHHHRLPSCFVWDASVNTPHCRGWPWWILSIQRSLMFGSSFVVMLSHILNILTYLHLIYLHNFYT